MRPGGATARFTSGVRALTDRLSRPTSSGRYLAFYRIFALKMTVFGILYGTKPFQTSNLAAIALFVAALASHYVLPTRIWVSPALYLVCTFSTVYRSFPATSNHHFLELLMVITICLFPPVSDPDVAEVDGTPVHFMQAAIAIAWMYAGLQKLLHGFWVDGEYLALTAFCGQPDLPLARLMRALLGAGDALRPKVGGSDPGTLGFTVHELPISAWRAVSLRTVGVATVVLEVVAPALLVARRSRQSLILALILLQAAISGLTGMLSFMFAGVICYALFLPERTQVITHRIIAVGLAGMLACGLLDNFGIVRIFNFTWA